MSTQLSQYFLTGQTFIPVNLRRNNNLVLKLNIISLRKNKLEQTSKDLDKIIFTHGLQSVNTHHLAFNV